MKFLWGSATSAHQVEGGNNNDWASWNDGSGIAADHYHRFEEDFNLAQSLNQNAHRISIEWSRIEPAENKFDTLEITHYKKVIEALRSRNIEPFVTLWHWTLPIWIHQKGGWTNEETTKHFVNFTEKIGIEFKDEIRFVPIAGMDIETIELFIESGSYELESGRLLKKGDTISIIVGSQYKHNAFFSKPADINDKILINDKLFTIKGNFKSVGNPSDDRLIYMPIENLRELFNIPDRIDTIIVQIEENGDIYQIADRINRRLINLRDTDKDNPDFSILTPEELLESFGSVLNIITAFLFGVAGISLLVGGIGIANTMFTSVLERTKEIGIMKAIGAQNKHIFLIFVIEAILLGTFGGFLGVVFGILIAKTIEYIAVVYLATTLLKSAIPLYLIAGCIAFSSVVGAVSGFWPAYRAVKTIPVQALRYE